MVARGNIATAGAPTRERNESIIRKMKEVEASVPTVFKAEGLGDDWN